MSSEATYSARGAALRLGVSRRRVLDAVHAGELRAHRLGARRLLILDSDLEAWVRSHQVPETEGTRRRVDALLAREEPTQAP